MAGDAGDASTEQIAILQSAVATGDDITEEQFRAAFQQSVECVRAAGFEVVETNSSRSGGQLDLTMVISINDLAFEQLMTDVHASCLNLHSEYLRYAFNFRARAQEITDEVIESHLPLLLSCLRERGASLAGDVTYDEAVQIDRDLVENHGYQTSCVEHSGRSEALGGQKRQ